MAEGANPRDIKVRFAQEIIARFHDQAAARRALEDFEARFRHGEVPQDLPEQVIEVSAEGGVIGQVLKSSGVCPSTSEALRMIEQGGVKVNGEKVADKGLRLPAGATYVLQVGKRKFARVSLRAAMLIGVPGRLDRAGKRAIIAVFSPPPQFVRGSPRGGRRERSLTSYSR